MLQTKTSQQQHPKNNHQLPFRIVFFMGNQLMFGAGLFKFEADFFACEISSCWFASMKGKHITLV